MENYKNYKQYFIENKTYKEEQTIKTIKQIEKLTKEDLQNMEDWQKNRLCDYLTSKQAMLLKTNELKELKKLLKNYKIKAKEKFQQAKEKATEEYNNILQLKDIKKAIFEIEWTKTRGTYGYQCKCYSKIDYKNGTYNYYESEKTGGCGYDKTSTALSYNMNKTCKILLAKHSSKILKDSEKHYNFYACENLYFSYGVGISSYIKMFKNMGYKVDTIYHQNEDITIIVEK